MKGNEQRSNKIPPTEERKHGREAIAIILERNDDDLGYSSAVEISKK